MSKQSLQLVSWNINGIRAAYKKGFLNWLATANPDVLALQESKIQAHQMQADMLEPPGGYTTYWAYAERPGYSGVGLLSKVKPERVLTGLGIERFDSEGRTIIAEYSDFVLFSHYYPNGGQGEHRIQYKLEFYDAFLEKALEYTQQGWAVLATGDFNTAHHAIDLARPKENENVTGFLPIERAWMDKFTEAGFVDTFRQVHGEKPDCYTWWNMRTRARERNVGWRIDYFFVSDNATERVLDAQIHSEVEGSDHCPVSIEWAI